MNRFLTTDFTLLPLSYRRFNQVSEMTDRVLMWTTIIDSEWFPKSN
ncbi:MAG: hypothetical protein J6W06_08895 [Bacteroidales bacterium]|nr:hypothetical protein [Bacteroidales bacterium]